MTISAVPFVLANITIGGGLIGLLIVILLILIILRILGVI